MNSNLERTIGVRVTQDLYDLLGRVCNDRGEYIASFARRAILRELAELSFLPSEQKKALGVTTQ